MSGKVLTGQLSPLPVSAINAEHFLQTPECTKNVDVSHQSTEKLSLKKWASVILIMLLTGLIYGTHLTMYSWQLEDEYNTLNNQMVAQYRSLYPKSNNIVDPVYQLKIKLQQTSKAQKNHTKKFVELLTDISPNLIEHLIVKNIRYSNNILKIDILSENFDELDKEKKTIIRKNYTVNIVGGRKNKQGKVEAQLKVEE